MSANSQFGNMKMPSLFREYLPGWTDVCQESLIGTYPRKINGIVRLPSPYNVCILLYNPHWIFRRWAWRSLPEEQLPAFSSHMLLSTTGIVCLGNIFPSLGLGHLSLGLQYMCFASTTSTSRPRPTCTYRSWLGFSSFIIVYDIEKPK